jgi:aldehyde:ferredoxin oxidoreductase
MDYYGRKVLGDRELSKLLDEYYEDRGWCVSDGIPTRRKIEDLGLETEAQQLKNSCFKSDEA